MYQKVQALIKWKGENKMENLNFIEQKMKNREFVLDHISIGIQKESEEMVVKKKSDFDGMDFY